MKVLVKFHMKEKSKSNLAINSQLRTNHVPPISLSIKWGIICCTKPDDLTQKRISEITSDKKAFTFSKKSSKEIQSTIITETSHPV